VNRPYTLTVYDDRIVLKSVEQDLNCRYAKEYRILSINSGNAALDYLRRMQREEDQAALLLIDRRARSLFSAAQMSSQLDQPR
jgi:hypothetical protein